MGYVTDKGRELAKGLLKKLWDESKPGLDRSGVNRFRYDAGNVRLFGRDDELAFLWEFCHSDNHFSWFAISGEGGSGKTRLAYTLGKLLKYAPGWSYRKVDYARPDGLADAKQALKDAPQNTLLVLDYVKWHTDSIGKWLYDLWCDWHDRNLKVRVLLVERDAISPRDLRWQHDVMAAQYRPAADAPFLDENNLMRLRPLDDDDMINVVNDYSAAFDAQVDAPLIIETLKKIDPQLRRPLYALFLADAQLMGNDLHTWDREDALEYVYLKEHERILLNADGLPAKLQDVVFRALLVATLSGGMEYDKFAEIMPGEVAMLQEHAAKDYSTAPELLAICLGIPYDEGELLRIPPLEPDLMGEFFCVKELWQLKDKQRQEVMGLAILNDLRRAAVVFDRIAHDYRDLLRDMKMAKLFTEISLPNSIASISEDSFRDCSHLTSIIIPESVASIARFAFSHCENLSSIVIPDSVISIGYGAFEYCCCLNEVKLSKRLISIENCVFVGCIWLTHIDLPDNLVSIGDWVFSDCVRMASITLSDSIEHIGNNMFTVWLSNISQFCLHNPIGSDDKYGPLALVSIRGKTTDVIRQAFAGMNVTFHELPKEAANSCISPPNAV